MVGSLFKKAWLYFKPYESGRWWESGNEGLEASCSLSIRSTKTHTKASRQSKAKWKTQDALGIRLSPGPGFRNSCGALHWVVSRKVRLPDLKSNSRRIIKSQSSNIWQKKHYEEKPTFTRSHIVQQCLFPDYLSKMVFFYQWEVMGIGETQSVWLKQACLLSNF